MAYKTVQGPSQLLSTGYYECVKLHHAAMQRQQSDPEWHALLATACEQHASHGLIAPDETILAETLQASAGPIDPTLEICGHCPLLSAVVDLIRSCEAHSGSNATLGLNSPG